MVNTMRVTESPCFSQALALCKCCVQASVWLFRQIRFVIPHCSQACPARCRMAARMSGQLTG